MRPNKDRPRGRVVAEAGAADHREGHVSHAINPSEAGTHGRQGSRRLQTRSSIAVVVAALVLGAAWWSRLYVASNPHAGTALPPEVVVANPLQRELDTRLGFLGQFSAVNEVELRAQVGGTLKEIHFKDGDIVHQGDLLFVIDEVPYEIRLAQATAQLETAAARLELADRKLTRSVALKRTNAASGEEVDQRTSDQRAAQAALNDAHAQIRDARFDLDHCRITAPFMGRIGTHLVSVGNLVAGSRAGTSPTTLLATLVSLDPIYLNFDMSESDYLAFWRERAKEKGVLGDKIEIALGDETDFGGQGTLDFVDNTLNRSSGTIHARATVSNNDLLLTPGVFARVRLVVGAPVATLLVPDAAVMPDQSEHVVLTVGPDSTVVPKRVEIGDLRDGLRVIRSGLAPSDKVIVEGMPFAAPGSKVAPHEGALRVAASERNGQARP